MTRIRQWIDVVIKAEIARCEALMDEGSLIEAARASGKVEAFREVCCMVARGYLD